MEMLVKNLFMTDNSKTNNTAEETLVMSAADENLKKRLDEALIKTIGLAQAYVPSQPWTAPMEEMNALACGTAFCDLVMPYVKGSSLKRNNAEVSPR